MAATKQNVKSALAFLAERKQAVRAGKLLSAATKKPFHSAAEVFLKWNDGEKKSSTAKRTRGSLASAKEFFRDLPVNEISAGHIEDYKQWRRDKETGLGVEECTLRNDILNLSLFFQYAKKHSWCEGNPTKEVAKPSNKDAERMYILSEEEERRYFAAALKRSQDLYDVARIMILQGPRPEHVFPIKVKHCDLINGTLFIPRGKSKASERILLMHYETRIILERRCQGRGPEDWCFPAKVKNIDGIKSEEKRHIVKLTNAHESAANEAGITCVLYDMRHTFATRAAADGMPIPALSAILGHAHISSTMKYVHMKEKEMARAMREMWEKTEPKAAEKEMSESARTPKQIVN